MKKLTWKDGTVINVKLREDLFTLAQMRLNHCMQFFDIRNSDGIWQGIDLNSIKPLFCAFVAENRLKPLFVETLPGDKVIPNHRPMPNRMIKYRFGGEGNNKADLVELDEGSSGINARVIRANLTTENDLDTIYKYEYVGMIGDPEKLRKRLVRYFDTGVNWDDSKAFIFAGIQPPPANYV